MLMGNSIANNSQIDECTRYQCKYIFQYLIKEKLNSKVNILRNLFQYVGYGFRLPDALASNAHCPKIALINLKCLPQSIFNRIHNSSYIITIPNADSPNHVQSSVCFVLFFLSTSCSLVHSFASSISFFFWSLCVLLLQQTICTNT